MACIGPSTLPKAVNVFDSQRDARNPSAVRSDPVSVLSSSSEESVDALEEGLVKKHSSKMHCLRTVTPPVFTSSTLRKTTFAIPRWKGKQRQPIPKLLIWTITLAIASVVLTSLLIYYIRHLRSLIPPNNIEKTLASWGLSDYPKQATANLPTDFSRDIIPIPCHSHNDYWRQVPLYNALAAGCSSVEADVWLSDGNLFVGHTEQSLTKERTLKSLYIDPIVSLLSIQNKPSQTLTTNLTSPNTTTASPNGVFETSPQTPLILLIDIKTDGESTFPTVLDQLEPLRSRGWLTHFNGTAVIPGPVTVVGTGNTPFDLLTSNQTYRDIFYDAPLAELWGDDPTTTTTNTTNPYNQLLLSTRYTAQNSYYASVRFETEIGPLWHGTLTPQQVLKIRGQIQGATERGLKARYWDTPSWPVGRRDHVWDVLMREGVGALSVDDLEAARGRNWGG